MPPEATLITKKETGQEARHLRIADAPERLIFTADTIAYFDRLAANPKRWERKTRAYVRYTIDFLRGMVAENKRVLLLGCPHPEVLAALKPSLGVGMHISRPLVEWLESRNSHPNLKFHCGPPAPYPSREPFDYVIVLNHIEWCNDVLELLEAVKDYLHEHSTLILSRSNPIWHPAIRLTSLIGLRLPDHRRTRLSNDHMQNVLDAKGLEYTTEYNRVLLPRRIPLLSFLTNTYVARLPFLNRFCYVKYTFARLNPAPPDESLTCSVIIPCYNEEGNVRECALRVPRMGKWTEVIIVDDGSTDRTVEFAKELEREYPQIRLIESERNEGKGKAVHKGLMAAKGDVVFILDADMTVPPEELRDGFGPFLHRKADYVSGTRFVYPMEKKAMRGANYVGNILFAKMVQVIVGSPCTDTLCGTKIMRRTLFADMKLEESSWGDFDFIFHAAMRKLRAMEIPFHYKNRVAGESKMKALSAGTRFLLYCLRKWSSIT